MNFQTNLPTIKQFAQATGRTLNDERISWNFQSVVDSAVSFVSTVSENLQRARETAFEVSGKMFSGITLPDGDKITFVFSKTNGILVLTQVMTTAETGGRKTILFGTNGEIKSVFSSEEGLEFYPDGRPKSFFKITDMEYEARWNEDGTLHSMHKKPSSKQ